MKNEKEIITKTPVLEIMEAFGVKNLNQEALLDLTGAIVPKLDGLNQIGDSDIYLRLNGSLMTKDIDKIKVNNLTNIYNLSLNLGDGTGNYLTGIRLKFGYDLNELRLIYQPVYMKFVQINPNDSACDDYKVLHEGADHLFTGSTFVSINSSTVVALMENYKQNIKIKHHVDSGFLNFIENKDVKSMVFPFQLLFSVLIDNAPAQDIQISNSVVKDSRLGRNIHRVLLSTHEHPIAGPFTDNYANRSRLCPPKCSGVLLSYRRG